MMMTNNLQMVAHHLISAPRRNTTSCYRNCSNLSRRLKKRETMRNQQVTTTTIVVALHLIIATCLLCQLASASSVAEKLVTRGKQLVEGAKPPANQLGDWLVHQVAPVVATKLIDNVLASGDQPSKQQQTKSSTIDTHALADRIVDRLAEGIKKQRQHVEPSNKETATTSRKGKSLVSDGVQHEMQNLFSKENSQRTFLGRAMEKHTSRGLGSRVHHQNNHQNNNNNNNNAPNSNWLMVKEPVYEPHLFVSTDSSQLDENPVVLRAEHGHNSTSTSTSAPPTAHISYAQKQQQQQRDKLKQQQQQNRYNSAVHTNRHNLQQPVGPRPNNNNWQHQNRRPQQSSPYSLPVTSDINVVQAPSSPAPPPLMTTTTTTTSTQPTTTSTTSTTTALPIPYQQITQVSANKFKINNRHQTPSSTVAISPSSWYSSNHNSRPYAQHHAYQHRYPLPSASTTSSTTTTTTTTTTTSTTTPEPQTETMMSNNEMTGGNDLDEQTSSPVSSILSSVAQSALEALGPSSSSSNQIDDYNYHQHTNSSGYNSYQHQHSQATKSAPPATTSARHSILSSEAIPTALGAPLYIHPHNNHTAHSHREPLPMPPPRRVGDAAGPAAKAVAQYLQKSMNQLSSNIFSRQSKGWARRLGLGSMLLSGILYGAAVLKNPGAPLPSNGLEVLAALSKGVTASSKKRRGGPTMLTSGQGLGAISSPNVDSLLSAISMSPSQTMSNNAAALLDNNVNLLYQQQPHLITIIEQLIQQEQLQLQQQAQQQQQQQQQHQQQQSSTFSQRTLPRLEIENVQELESETQRRVSANPLQPPTTSQQQQQQANLYTIQALPSGQFLFPTSATNQVDYQQFAPLLTPANSNYLPTFTSTTTKNNNNIIRRR